MAKAAADDDDDEAAKKKRDLEEAAYGDPIPRNVNFLD